MITLNQRIHDMKLFSPQRREGRRDVFSEKIGVLHMLQI